MKSTLFKILLGILIFWALMSNLLGSRYQIFEETAWIRQAPFAPFEEKLKYRIGVQFYNFIIFVRDNTPKDAVIMFPPQGDPFPQSGNLEYIQYFLYPRKLVKDDRERLLTDKSITHIFLDWGETSMPNPKLNGYPKYYVPVKKIITLSGKTALYPAHSPYLEKYGLIEIERGKGEIPQNDHFARAEFLRARGEFTQALRELQLAQTLFPNYPWVYYLLADTWENLGRQDLAISLYQKTISLEPENSWFYFSLGRAYERVGKREKAKEEYLKSLKISPDSTWSSFALGRIYEQGRELVSAYLYYEQANFANWGPTSLDSKRGQEGIAKLTRENPHLPKLVEEEKKRRKASELTKRTEIAKTESEVKIIDGFEGKVTGVLQGEYEFVPGMLGEAIVKIIDGFEGKVTGVLQGEYEFVPGMLGEAILLKDGQIAYPRLQFSPKSGSINFYWRPPKGINNLPPQEVIDLLHQLGRWPKRDGSLYLWVGRNYLAFGIFDGQKSTWEMISSPPLFWKEDKWYLLSISFGEKGMNLAIDGKEVGRNNYQKPLSDGVIFLGGGREVFSEDFFKESSAGAGSFDELIFNPD